MAPTEFTARMGANLRRLREHRGWSAEMVADMMGITLDSVYKYESGARKLHGELIMQAAVILDCSILDIYNGLDPRHPNESTKELNTLSPNSSTTMRWLATEWSGDVEALVAYMGTIATFPEEVRRETYMDGLHQRDELLRTGIIARDQLPPGTANMEQSLGGLYAKDEEDY